MVRPDKMAKKSGWLLNKGDVTKEFGESVANLTPLEETLIKLTAKKIAERLQAILTISASTERLKLNIEAELDSLLREIEES